MKVEILKGLKGKWYWRIKGRNGKILAASETYSTKAMAVKTFLKVREELSCGLGYELT